MKLARFTESPQGYLRLAGLLYLAIIILGIFGEVFVRQKLVIGGDADATALGIVATPLLWRGGIAGDLVMHIFDIPIIVVLYLLLKPVNHGLALLATLANLVQTAVLAINKLNLLMPLSLLSSGVYAQAFTPEQLHALSYLSIAAHNQGFGIGLIFFGVACLVRGYLLYHCTFMPKFLGLLMLVAGLVYLVNSFALILSPSLASQLFPAILLPAFVGELAFCLWLMFKGVDLPLWQRQQQAQGQH